MSKVNGRADERTPPMRTDHSRMYPGVPAAADGSSVQHTCMQSPRDSETAHSSRAERLARGIFDPARPCGPEGAARKATADHFNLVLERRMANDEEWASNRAIGAKCGVDESVIRHWRSAEKSIPLAALLVLPAPVVADMVGFVLDRRGLNAHRSGLPMLREALQRLDADVPPADREAVLDALAEASARLSARLSRLATKGK